MANTIGIYKFYETEIGISPRSNLSVTSITNPTITPVAIYQNIDGIFRHLITLYPKDSVNLYDLAVRQGTDLMFSLPGGDFYLDAPGHASILISYNEIFVNNTNSQRFEFEGDIWDTHAGYGLIDYAAALDVSPGAPISVSAPNNNLDTINSLNVNAAHSSGYTGSGVTIAVVGDGIESGTEIDEKIISSYKIDTGTTYDGNGAGSTNAGWHDLAVASILVGARSQDGNFEVVGVAPDANLLNVSYGNSSDFWDGVIWAVDRGAKVILIEVSSNAHPSEIPQIWKDAVEYAHSNNSLVIFTSGNNVLFGNGDIGSISLSGQSLTEGNFDLYNNQLFPSSNLAGATPFPFVSAPSTGYALATWGFHYWLDGGTSFAGPYVAGLAALLFEKYPQAGVDFILNRITDTASLANVNPPIETSISDDAYLNIVEGTFGDETINAAGPAPALIFANGGGQEITGSDAGDSISTGPGDHSVFAGSGNDEIRASNGDDILSGEAGDDHISGGPGADTIRGGTGNDVLYGGGGNDILDGGDGLDSATYKGFRENYSIEIDDGDLIVTDLIEGDRDLLYNIETINFFDKSIEFDFNILSEHSRSEFHETTRTFTEHSISEITPNYIELDINFSVHNVSKYHIFIYDSLGYKFGSVAPGDFRSYVIDGFAEFRSEHDEIAFQVTTGVSGNLYISDAGNYFDYSEGRDQFEVDGDLWDTYLGFGLIDFEAALDVPASTELSVGPSPQSNNFEAVNVVNAQSAYAAGLTGEGVIISVVGVGIASHAAVDPSIVASYDFETGSSDASPTTQTDHDLAVASILVGVPQEESGYEIFGIARNADLLNVRIGNSPESALADAIYWSVDNGAKVILFELSNGEKTYPTFIIDAVDYAFENDVVVVFTSGNNSIYGGASLGLAAQSGKAIVVGNYNIYTGAPWSTSNLAGDTIANWVMAPSTGTVQYSDGINWLADGGTSFAGPYVAGLAALIFEKYPDASAEFVIGRITSTTQLSDLNYITEGPISGSNADDVIVGRDQDDVFIPIGGSDIIDGKDGYDTLFLPGSKDIYTISNLPSYDLVQSNQSQQEFILYSIENIQFLSETPLFLVASQSITLDEDTSATVTVSATDADGDTLTYSVSTAASHGTTSVSGNTITYTPLANYNGTDSFVVTADDGNGGTATQTINVTVNAVDEPVPSGPTFRLITAAGWSGTVAGDGNVLGSSGSEVISVAAGDVTFDASFNRGGDGITLAGNSSDYTIVRNGSAATLTNGTITATIPLGTAGITLSFDNGTFSLIYDGAFKIGDQVFSNTAIEITASADGSQMPNLTDTALRARALVMGDGLPEGQSAHLTIGGTAVVFGSADNHIVAAAPGERVDLTFDASFNGGGDTIVLDLNASSYVAVRSGSQVMLTADNEAFTIPVGTAGMTLSFADGDRTLIFSLEEGQIKIGDDAITSTPTALTPSTTTGSLDDGNLPLAYDAFVFDQAIAEQNIGFSFISFG